MRKRSESLIKWVALLGMVWLFAHGGWSAVAHAAFGSVSGDSDQAAAAGHADPVTPVLLGISIILLAAKVGGDLMVRVRQPAVLGELLVGVLLGNLVLFGFDGLEFLRPGTAHADAVAQAANGGLAAQTLDILARIGVILLLFEVGLESNLREMRKVGLSAFVVAVLGVVTPMGLGWLTSRWLLPDSSWHVHLFIGATLCATSVGITARVLKDLGKTDVAESKIILGAAVIDDVLGLVVLAVVQAIIVQGTASPSEVVICAASSTRRCCCWRSASRSRQSWASKPARSASSVAASTASQSASA